MYEGCVNGFRSLMKKKVKFVGYELEFLMRGYVVLRMCFFSGVKRL